MRFAPVIGDNNYLQVGHHNNQGHVFACLLGHLRLLEMIDVRENEIGFKLAGYPQLVAP